jgi:hypothetical protein
MDGERSNEGINVLKKESLGPTSVFLEPGAHFFSDLPDKGGLYGEVPKDIKLKVLFFGKLNRETGFTKCQILRIVKFHGETEIPNNSKNLDIVKEGEKPWSVTTLNWVYCPNGELEERIAEKKKKEDEAHLAAEKIWEESRKRDQEIIRDLERIKEEKEKSKKIWVPKQREEFIEESKEIKEETEEIHKKEWLPYKDEYQPMSKKRRKKS